MIKRLRFWIDHRWTPGHLSEYVDGELASAGRARIERHVHDCPKCRELLRNLRSILTSLGGLRRSTPGEPGESIGPVLLVGVRGRLGREYGDELDP